MASGSKMPKILPPPEGYEFDNLIADIASKITPRELQILKERFTVIKHLDSAKAMLHFLMNKGFIGQNNILYIQQVVRVLGRRDLVEILVRYIEMFEEDKVLHFITRSTKTADGYKIVEFHILGPLDTNKLDEIRRDVSRLLLCPLHEVIVKGIQETGSILLTLMLPTMYVEFLTTQLQKHNQRIIISLMLMDMDKVILDKNEFLLQKEDDIYKANKSNFVDVPVKLGKTVCRAAATGKESGQTQKHFSAIHNTCLRHGTKRSSSAHKSRTKKPGSEIGTGPKRLRPKNGILAEK